MAIYGYIRRGFPISKDEQLTKLRPFDCEEIYLEEYLLSRSTELEVLLSRIESGDQVVVTNLQVFGRTVRHLIPIMKKFEMHQIRFISLMDTIDTKKDQSFYSHFKLISRMDTECHRKKTKQQYDIARMEGSTIGRPTLREEIIHQIYDLYHEKKWSMRQIANACDVSLGSVYKYTHRVEGRYLT